MTGFVSDTHALVWHLVEPKRLGQAARRSFTAADEGRALCQIPAVCLVEVSLLHERGRLRIGAAQVLEAVAGRAGYALLPLDMEQCIEFSALIGIKDPMDRLIAAAARVIKARLVSSDDVFDEYLDRVWD